MKDWAEDHPKAKLMARKRAAILKAARDAFLSLGYEGASMEAIAAKAGVSIMTLYRHAQSKNALFAAVIASACDPDDAERAQFASLMKQPLRAILVAAGIRAQQQLSDPGTVALLRTVMAEAARFPELAEIAYRGFVGHLEEMVEHVLEQKTEARRIGKAERSHLARAFIDTLFGADMLRVLLGLSGVSAAEQRRRAERARDEIMAAVDASMRPYDKAARQ